MRAKGGDAGSRMRPLLCTIDESLLPSTFCGEGSVTSQTCEPAIPPLTPPGQNTTSEREPRSADPLPKAYRKKGWEECFRGWLIKQNVEKTEREKLAGYFISEKIQDLVKKGKKQSK
ncbi:hypothetical protein KUCAC02_028189 [Chaenocephalus aceratus]|uniref:Uncharacterized protein n=1 Tax=Chaenocephalus aceratus TaxID=36190 RepID=A0ACB9X2W3_CHAAC|nr:hypothetical protein KUCAC02_028189 [Chaenocephalus aceratus]